MAGAVRDFSVALKAEQGHGQHKPLDKPQHSIEYSPIPSCLVKAVSCYANG
jgi:hypothetical protein